MMDLVFATNNNHKLQEIQEMLGSQFHLLSLNDIGCFDDIPEEQDTLEGNASQKAFYIYNKFGYSCFADDTGLEIDALNGEPGVYSARYAGEQRNADDNITKVLNELTEIKDRYARFRTVISLIINGVETQFDGVAEGEILHERHGSSGFGYDPVFRPLGYNVTFAEMEMSEKNKISHRGKAVDKLVEHLKTNQK